MASTPYYPEPVTSPADEEGQPLLFVEIVAVSSFVHMP